jgi:hypothetical protein
MKSIVIAVCLMLLLVAVPLQAQTLTDAQKAEIEKILSENHKEIFSSVNQLSSAGYTKYLSESFQEKAGSGNIQAATKDGFLKWLDSIFGQRANQTISPHNIKVFVLSPDSAYSLYIGGAQITVKNGRKGGYGNAMTFVWRKEPSGWKIVHLHESTW